MRPRPSSPRPSPCAVLLVAALAAACQQASEAGDVPSPVSLGAADVHPAWTADANVLAADLAKGGVKVFAAALAADPSANLVTSPLAAQLAVGMAYLAASGQTADAVAAAMGWQGAPADFAAAQKILLDRLADDLAASQTSPALTTATRLWVTDLSPLSAPFAAALADTYQAPAAPLPISTSPAQAAQLANAWAGQQTQKALQPIFPTGTPDAQSRLVATAALALTATWATPMATDITAGTMAFSAASGDTRQLTPLRLAATLAVSQAADDLMVSLPLAEGGLSVALLLPAGDVAALLADLDPTALAARLRGEGAVPTAVEISLPPFAIEQPTHDLAPLLAGMGAGKLFTASGDMAFFASQGAAALDAVYGQASIQVDAAGVRSQQATVAAADAAAAAPPAGALSVVFDRPFVFAVVHAATGAVVAMGAVLDPDLG